MIEIFTNDDDTTQTLDDINSVLNYIYLFEVVVKILGIGIVDYFKDNWNM